MASALNSIIRLKRRTFSDDFYEVNQRRVRYRGGLGSVGRRDFSLRAVVSVPVVLPCPLAGVSVPKKIKNPWAAPGCRIEETQSRFHFMGVGVARVGCGALVQ